jgi:hypothetical protein
MFLLTNAGELVYINDIDRIFHYDPAHRADVDPMFTKYTIDSDYVPDGIPVVLNSGVMHFIIFTDYNFTQLGVPYSKYHTTTADKDFMQCMILTRMTQLRSKGL